MCISYVHLFACINDFLIDGGFVLAYDDRVGSYRKCRYVLVIVTLDACIYGQTFVWVCKMYRVGGTRREL